MYLQQTVWELAIIAIVCLMFSIFLLMGIILILFFSPHLVEHLHKSELRRFFREFRCILKPNGKFIAHTCPNKWYRYIIYRFYTNIIILIEVSCNVNQYLSKVSINVSVTAFIGISKSTSSNVTSDAQMVKCILYWTKAGFNVTKTFSVSKLNKYHTKKLI